MKYLKDRVVYLCGPIKDVSDDGTSWRDYITPKLKEYGLGVLDPCQKANGKEEIGDAKRKFKEIIMREDWKTLKEEFWPVVRWDLRSVDVADFVIVDYNPEVNTVGTIHELVVASFEKKPILLKYNKSQLEKFNPWIGVFIKTHHFFPTWDDMFKYLDEVDAGRLDTSLWV